MADLVYIYEEGCCRGQDFSNKLKIDRMELLGILRPISVKLTAIVEKFDLGSDAFYEAFDAMIDEVLAGIESDMYNVIRGMVHEDFESDDSPAFVNSNIAKLENKEAFALEMEESTFGIAYTAKDAVMACKNVTEEDW